MSDHIGAKVGSRAAALFLGVAVALFTLVVPTAAHAAAPTRVGVLAAPPTGALYQLLNLGRGQCVAGQSSNRVNLSGCNVTFSDQYWLLEPAPAAGFYRLRGLATAKCLAIISNGNVRVSGCVDSFNDQWWRLDPTPAANSYMLYNHLRGTCLAGPRANGAATSFGCTPGFTDQWWSFIAR